MRLIGKMVGIALGLILGLVLFAALDVMWAVCPGGVIFLAAFVIWRRVRRDR